MRDAYPGFEAEGIKLYAISYDDGAALSAFAENQRIPFPLLSDGDSTVIRRYGILNEQVPADDPLLYGIPYPGTFVCDADGIVVSKFFHDSYKKRDSGATLIGAALGRIVVNEAAPSAVAGGEGVTITASLQGGNGSLRQGVIRQLVLQFSLDDGLHVYGPPVPDGMIPLQISVTGPPGFVAETPQFPPDHDLYLQQMDVHLKVWDGTFAVGIPVYATSVLASETRPLDQDRVTLHIAIRFQACDDNVCLLPRTVGIELSVPLEVVDVPNLAFHTGHGQREGTYDNTPHLRRLLRRGLRRNPLAFVRFIARTLVSRFTR